MTINLEQKYQNAINYIWDMVDGNNDLFAIALYNIGYTYDEIYEELQINCGLYDDECEAIIDYVKEVKGDK